MRKRAGPSVALLVALGFGCAEPTAPRVAPVLELARPATIDPGVFRIEGDEATALPPLRPRRRSGWSPRAVGLTLDRVIHAAWLADPQLRAGLESINQARADACTGSLVPNPTLRVSQALLPLTRPFTVDRQGGPPQ